MEISELVHKQISIDRTHGFEVEFNSEEELVTQIERDLIGLTGEVGEFANIVKKIRLNIEHNEYEGPTLTEAQDDLREELADVLIYLMRISAELQCDLEAEVLKKMNKNVLRYNRLDR